jgi:hypothetical protein
MPRAPLLMGRLAVQRLRGIHQNVRFQPWLADLPDTSDHVGDTETHSRFN